MRKRRKRMAGVLLFDVLTRFSELAVQRKDNVFADTCRKAAEKLRSNAEAHAWDGNWYNRAFFDDGTPLWLVPQR